MGQKKKESFDPDSFGNWKEQVPVPGPKTIIAMRWDRVPMCGGFGRFISFGLAVHEAIEFDVKCADGSIRQFTVDLWPTDTGDKQDCVNRRWGRYETHIKYLHSYEMSQPFDDVMKLTYPTEMYSLLGYNCKEFARQLYYRIN